MNGPDRGSGTVLTVALVAVGCLLGMLVSLFGQAVAARHRAQAAADLAALAAASAWPVADCTRAAGTASANGAGLDSCLPGSDGSVAVRVVVALPAPLAAFGPARAVARAGQPAAGDLPGSAAAPTPGPGLRRSTCCGDTGTADAAAAPAGTGEAARTASSSRAAAALSRGSFPLPHLGDCTQDGQPVSHSQSPSTARVARSQVAAQRYPRSANPAPPG